MALSKTKEGVWCPSGRSADECDILFVGDSIFRHLSKHIPDTICDLVPGVCFYAGRTVSTLFGNFCQYVSQKTKILVLHVGTNDVSNCRNGTPGNLLSDFETLLANIKERSPQCQIFISSILPRARSLVADRYSPYARSAYVGKLNSIISIEIGILLISAFGMPH